MREEAKTCVQPDGIQSWSRKEQTIVHQLSQQSRVKDVVTVERRERRGISESARIENRLHYVES